MIEVYLVVDMVLYGINEIFIHNTKLIQDLLYFVLNIIDLVFLLIYQNHRDHLYKILKKHNNKNPYLYLYLNKYVLVCYDPEHHHPCLVVSLESSNKESEQNKDEALWFLCVFFASEHKNLGVVERNITVNEFETYAKAIASKMLCAAQKHK